MDRLVEGYRRFRIETWPGERDRYETLAKGQSPRTLVISCSDSRVDPQTIFGAAPGELFVVRNIAALVPPYQPDSAYHGTSAALEYGVRVLKVERIVVLGHAQCGGVHAMVDGVPDVARDFVEPWLNIARPAMPRPRMGQGGVDAWLLACETAIVRLSMRNLRTFPWIEGSVAGGRLRIEGYRFDIHTGVLARLERDGFVPVAIEA